MPKPSSSTSPDLEHLDHITPAQWILLWDEYAKAALHGCLSFHGADSSCADSGVTHIALLADQMMTARMERVMGIKEAQQIAKDEEKTKPTTTSKR